MNVKNYRYDGSQELSLKKAPTSAKGLGLQRQEIEEKTRSNMEKIAKLQDKLYAQGQEGIVILLQAMDAAGKDSAIKHVMGAVNPQGITVHSFKQPNSQELSHDYLWRAVRQLPARGSMAIFNRSYYEDVLIARVHSLHKGYQMAQRCLDDPEFFQKRYRQIRHFEEYLYENSYRVVKVFLHVSKEEQKERFLERIERKEKNWKFSQSDVKERAYWEEYQKAYEKAINQTATPHSPWYVLPADNKWYTRYLLSQAVLETLKDIDPQYPAPPPEQEEQLQQCRKMLEEEC